MSRSLAAVDTFTAIADPTRRRILTMLGSAREERTLTEIALPFAVTLSAISQHLRVLLEVDLVTVRRVGRERRYTLNAEPLKEVAEWVRTYEGFWDEKIDALGVYLDRAAAEEASLPARSPDPSIAP